jgi:hypothetical protein
MVSISKSPRHGKSAGSNGGICDSQIMATTIRVLYGVAIAILFFILVSLSFDDAEPASASVRSPNIRTSEISPRPGYKTPSFNQEQSKALDKLQDNLPVSVSSDSEDNNENDKSTDAPTEMDTDAGTDGGGSNSVSEDDASAKIGLGAADNGDSNSDSATSVDDPLEEKPETPPEDNNVSSGDNDASPDDNAPSQDANDASPDDSGASPDGDSATDEPTQLDDAATDEPADSVDGEDSDVGDEDTADTV